jgi:hypothetical protein
MLFRQYSSNKMQQPKSKREYLKQNFVIHHPLLEQIMQSKLERCLRHGVVRDHQKNNIISNNNAHVIEAPCIMGKLKRI